MKEKVLIVDRICKLIKDNDLTNQKVETELGWGSGAIKKFDNNRPSIDKIIELAEYLGVSVNDIIFDNINERTLSDKKYEPISLNDTVSCRGKVIGKLSKKDILEQD